MDASGPKVRVVQTPIYGFQTTRTGETSLSLDGGPGGDIPILNPSNAPYGATSNCETVVVGSAAPSDPQVTAALSAATIDLATAWNAITPLP